MRIEFSNMPTSAIKPDPSNPRNHPRRQKELLEKSIKKTGFTGSIVVNAATHVIIDGNLRYELAKARGDTHIHCTLLWDLRPGEAEALAIALNKVPSLAGWSHEKLVKKLSDIVEISGDHIEITDTGFEVAEFDQLKIDFDDRSDPSDKIDPRLLQLPGVAKAGDLYILGQHRLLCGDSKSETALDRLMNRVAAACVVTDLPYNVQISSVVGRGSCKYREFAEASGEMSRAEFATFLRTTLANGARVSTPGSLHYAFMDWGHLEDLLAAGRDVFGGNLRNIIAWVNSNAGMGSFYRSQHEFVCVFQCGNGKPVNNIQLGKLGRNRTNVWTYPGANAFGATRLKDLALHPTVKPVRMIADIMLDCTKRGDVCLDLFAGSGTVFLAAEKVGRRAFGMEIDPIYVDTAIRRWQKLTGQDAILEASGSTFTELERERSAAPAHEGDV